MSLLLLLPVLATSQTLPDLARFPACVTDPDCAAVSGRQAADYKCFQYMCFPWADQSLGRPYRACKRRSDCEGLLGEEGGDGGPGECYRHRDRRRVHGGICLTRR